MQRTGVTGRHQAGWKANESLPELQEGFSNQPGDQGQGTARPPVLTD